MAGVIAFYIRNNKRLSQHIDQISQRISSTNHRINSYYKTSTIIVYLVNKKGNINDESSPKLTLLGNDLLMRIVETTEKGVSEA